MSQDVSWEVLQRELVEATQALTIVQADQARRETEARNAIMQVEAAQAKVDDIQAAYDAARGINSTPEATPEPHPVVAARPAALVPEAPSL